MRFNPVYNKKPRGASVEGEEVFFSLVLSEPVQAVKILIKKDDEASFMPYEMSCKGKNYEFRHTFDKGLFWYYFEVYANGKVLKFGQNDLFEAQRQENVKAFAHLATKAVEARTNMGVVYHIFVDRFCKEGKVKVRPCFNERKDWGGVLTKNTGDPVELNKEVFCGNLQGVISKLPYLESLGVETIYLSPIMLSNSYHKYDTASYLEVDPMFGGDTALKMLIKAANQKGMKVLLDGVYNHTGSDSIYFNKEGTFDSVGAYNSKESQYYDWYNFSQWPTQYDAWWGISSLPAVNEKSSFVDFITGKGGVLDKWLSFGVAGFRLDVLDELGDEFVDKIAKRVKSHGNDCLLLGEVWEDASTKIAYGCRRKYFENDQIDSVMNYPLKNGILSYILSGNANEYVKNVYMLLDHYPKQALNRLLNLIGTHDSKRIASVIAEKTANPKEQLQLLKVATLLQFGFIGSPSVFYGDERGMLGGEAPLCRGCFPWERTNTESEKWYKFLGKLSKDKILREGDYELMYAKGGVIVFRRTLGKQQLIFATNLSIAPYYLQIDEGYDILNKSQVTRGIGVAPNDIAILRIRGEKK